MTRLTKIRYHRNFSVLQPLYFILFVLVCFYSCVSISMQTLNIQVSGKEKFPLPDNIQSITILNRSIKPGFTNLTADSLGHLLKGRNYKIDTLICDITAADSTIKSVARYIYESGRYDVVVPLFRNIDRKDTNSLQSPLPYIFIEEICKDFRTDAVLVLESFDERLVSNFKQIPVKDEPDLKERKMYVDYNAVWRLYQPCKTCPVKRYDTSDTIYWESHNISMNVINYNMPTIKKALVGGGIACALNMAELISPGWVDQTRKYYLTGDKQIDLAIPLIKNNKWQEAAEIWTKFTTTHSPVTRSKIEFNLALANEMNGDLDQAINWGNKSLKTHYSIVTEEYIKLLDYRRKGQQNMEISDK